MLSPFTVNVITIEVRFTLPSFCLFSVCPKCVCVCVIFPPFLLIPPLLSSPTYFVANAYFLLYFCFVLLYWGWNKGPRAC